MKVFLIGIVTIFAICLLVTSHAVSLRPHGKYHERLVQEEKEQLKASGIEGEDANHLLEWASSNVMLPNMHGNEKEEELTKEEQKIEKMKKLSAHDSNQPPGPLGPEEPPENQKR